MSPLPQLHEPDEVAAALGVSRRWLLENAALHPDRVPSIKIARRILFTDEQVEVILVNHTRAAAPPTSAERAADAWGRPRNRTPRPSRAAMQRRAERWS